ncbi:glycosyl hydrolase 115 family protein, partial [candidate division KSB1 bacterium]|nr:glycosyl hydrolase 115 family protein [candidate division KSB1 bacterium]
WIVNVGDIKPMEFPISFFLEYAWNPEVWPAERLPEYTRLWAGGQFGTEYAAEIAEILTQYTRYNSRRKPELLSPETYSLTHYREAETVVSDYNALAIKALNMYETLPAEYKDAFYQLILHPVLACANLNELYVTVGRNRLYASQGRASTNTLAQKVKNLFAEDAEITRYYNQVLADGKWNHMMDQTHIGYTYWQQPDTNTMPAVEEISIPAAAEMGIALEGAAAWRPDAQSEAVLPVFDAYNRQQYYIEVFNRGQTPFDFTVEAAKDWLQCRPSFGRITDETRIYASVRWEKAPFGKHRVPLVIKGAEGNQVTIFAVVHNPLISLPEEYVCFVESNGYVSMEAKHYSRMVNTSATNWQLIPTLGHTLSAMTPFPVTAAPQMPDGDGARLEYDMQLFSTGEVTVKAYLSPTLNFHNNQGLRYAVSFDDEPAQVVNMHADRTFQDWEESVRNNITLGVSKHHIHKPGLHVLKLQAIDAGVVVQKIVVETGQLPYSYLGPPESHSAVKTW